MASVSVTREEFKIRSELEIVHIPTGAVFQAYPYSKPDDMLQRVKVIWDRAGAPGESIGDYAEQIRRMALQLLLEPRTRPALGDWAMPLENIDARRRAIG